MSDFERKLDRLHEEQHLKETSFIPGVLCRECRFVNGFCPMRDGLVAHFQRHPDKKKDELERMGCTLGERKE